MGFWGYQPLVIPRTNFVYEYPAWANVLGWMVAASSVIFIPAVALYQILIAKGTFMEVLFSSVNRKYHLLLKYKLICFYLAFG